MEETWLGKLEWHGNTKSYKCGIIYVGVRIVRTQCKFLHTIFQTISSYSVTMYLHEIASNDTYHTTNTNIWNKWIKWVNCRPLLPYLCQQNIQKFHIEQIHANMNCWKIIRPQFKCLTWNMHLDFNIVVPSIDFCQILSQHWTKSATPPPSMWVLQHPTRFHNLVRRSKCTLDVVRTKGINLLHIL